MNILPLLPVVAEEIVAQRAAPAPMLKIVYWLLLILCAVGSFWVSGQPTPNVTYVRMNTVVLIILFAILGLYTFGF